MRMPGGTQRTTNPKRILVLQLCPLGDTLFGTPALRALRVSFPGAEITSVTWQANREILDGSPYVDHVVTCPSAMRLPQLMSRLAEGDFDTVVGLSNVGSWLTLFTRAQVRVGFNSQTLGWSYTADVPDRRDKHAVDYCLDVVQALGARPAGRAMDVPLGAAERDWARRHLAARGSQPALRVAIHPGGRHFAAKRWPAGGFACVADYLAAQYGAQVAVVGGRDDRVLAEAIASGCRVAEPLLMAGKARIKQTAALIEACDLFVGNDSAPLHMAVAVGTPAVALFGPTDPVNFRPLGPLDVVVRHPPACSPCFRWLKGSRGRLMARCRVERAAECMRAITPLDVIEAVEGQLDRLGLRQSKGLAERPPACALLSCAAASGSHTAPVMLQAGGPDRLRPVRECDGR